MLKILLLGKYGQLGWELNRSLLPLGDLVALDYPEINLASPDSIQNIVRDIRPDLVINATAYTNVDKAESEPELAMAINGIGSGILAEEVKKQNGVLIHYSTDYVFDGTKGAPYLETDEANPINVYGETKLAGEKAVQDVDGTYLIFRTSWVYSLRRPCFVTKVLKWAKENETLRIVDDQVSSPTWARYLAETTSQIVAQGRSKPLAYLNDKRGVYHLAGGGACSRLEWAQAILDMVNKRDGLLVKELLSAKSSDFPTPANRPMISVLNMEKIQHTFSLQMTNWEEQLRLLLSEL